MHPHPPTLQFNPSLHVLQPLFWTSIMGSRIHCDHQLLGFNGGICAPSSKHPMDIVIFFFSFLKIYTHTVLDFIRLSMFTDYNPDAYPGLLLICYC